MRTSWHRWTVLAMLAHAVLTVLAVLAVDARDQPPPDGLLPITVNEIRRLFTAIAVRPVASTARVLPGRSGGAATKPTPAPATTDDETTHPTDHKSAAVVSGHAWIDQVLAEYGHCLFMPWPQKEGFGRFPAAAPCAHSRCMYMVHIYLYPASGVPDDLPDLFTGHAVPDDELEHVSVHSARRRVAVTVFLCADSWSAAEDAALALCRRALAGEERLRGWAADGSGLGFVPAYYERLGAGPFLPQQVQEVS